MPKSEAFAIATQQSHATGHTPKDYGTSEGKQEAKKKYDEPKSEYTQTADPSSKAKQSSISLAMMLGFSDELQKIAGLPVPKRKKINTQPVTPSPLASGHEFVESGKTIQPPPASMATGDY